MHKVCCLVNIYGCICLYYQSPDQVTDHFITPLPFVNTFYSLSRHLPPIPVLLSIILFRLACAFELQKEPYSTRIIQKLLYPAPCSEHEVLRSICGVAWICGTFLSVAEQISIALFVYPFFLKWTLMACFQYGSIRNKFLQTFFYISFGSGISVCETLKKLSNYFQKPLNTPIGNAYQFQLLLILVNI